MAKKRGTAEIVEMGFDLDEVKRYAVFKFDPPMDDGTVYKRVLYSGVTLESDGQLMQAPMPDEHEIPFLRRLSSAFGYDLVTD